MSLQDLEKRIQRLEDIEEIRLLKHEYCAACDDKHNADRILAIFTEDGIWDGGKTFGRAEGHAEIYDLFHNHHKDNVLVSQHNVMNERIDVHEDGVTANATWYIMAPLKVQPGNRIWCIGRYEEEYVKVDGKWKIKKLNACEEDGIICPYEIGW